MVFTLENTAKDLREFYARDKQAQQTRGLRDLYTMEGTTPQNIVSRAIPIIAETDPAQAINLSAKQAEVEREATQLAQKNKQEMLKFVLTNANDSLKFMLDNGADTTTLSNYANGLREKYPELETILPNLSGVTLSGKDKDVVVNYNKDTGEVLFADKDKKKVEVVKAGTPSPPKPKNERIIPAGAAGELADMSSSIGLLNEFRDRISKIKNKLYFTPVVGAAAVLADDKLGKPEAKQYSSAITLLKQVIGKGLEGGVLRREDTEKYNQILLAPGATKAQIEAVTTDIENAIKNKRKDKLISYDSAGYDVSGYDLSEKPTTTTTTKPAPKSTTTTKPKKDSLGLF